MIKLFWANALNTESGNAYGYSMHYQNLRKACDDLGVVNTYSSPIAIHITTANIFRPVKGKINVCYTMFECYPLPKEWVETFSTVDVFIVPNNQNKILFAETFKKPVYVVPEGCDLEFYAYKKREKKTPFRFLWVGAPNVRKGYAHIGGAVDLWLEEYPNEPVEFYFKTTGIGREGFFRHPQLSNVVIDSRKVSREELREIYYSANAFLLPSMGEGWGLTLIEAAATGLPCIYTHWAGTAEFMRREFAYPVNWEYAKVKATNVKEGAPPHDAWAISADIKQILHRMEQVYFDYETAVKKGYKMSQALQKFTWENSAKVFIEALKKIAENYNVSIEEKDCANGNVNYADDALSVTM